MGRKNPELQKRRRQAREAAVSDSAGGGAPVFDSSGLNVDDLIPPTHLPDNWPTYKQKLVVDTLDAQATLLRGVITHGQLNGAAVAAALASGDAKRFSLDRVKRWLDGNVYGFKDRYDLAVQTFGQRVAMTFADRALNGQSGEKWDNLPGMALLNAYMPDRFVRHGTPQLSGLVEGIVEIGQTLREQRIQKAAEERERALSSRTAVERWLDSAPVATGGSDAEHPSADG